MSPDHDTGLEDASLAGGFELWIAEGGAAERAWRTADSSFSIGSHPSNELVLRDAAVSRFHCEVRFQGDAVLIRDLDQAGRAGAGAGKFQEARGRVLATFERSYLSTLLEQHDGKVAAAAEAAGLSRVYLYRLLAKYGLSR